MDPTVDPAVAWSRLLDELESSIADAECGGTGHGLVLDGVAERLGPIPLELADRAEHLARRGHQLADRLEDELRRVEHEMDRVAPRRRTTAPPAPSHLDHMA